MKSVVTGVVLVTAVVTLFAFPGCALFRADRDGRSGERPQAMSSEARQREQSMMLAEADTYRREGNYRAALELLEQAIEENPTLTQAHLSVGDIYREQGNYETAVDKYRVATELEPRNFDAHYYLALCLQLTERLTEAIRSYRVALSIDPESHEANLNIATAYLQADQPSDALPFAERAADLRPDNGPTHINLAAVYAALGQHGDAVREYQTAAELMELPPDILLNFVDSLRVLQRYSEMINVLEALVRIQPMTAAYERMGYAYFKMKRYRDSKVAYRWALNADETYYPAMNGLAVNLLNDYIQSGRIDVNSKVEAIRLLRTSVQTEPDQPRIIDLLARYGR